MPSSRSLLSACLFFYLGAASGGIAQATEAAPLLTPASVIENSIASDWRKPKQNRLLHLKTADGEVVFELAPEFAPQHVKNVRTLVAQKYFDGLAIIRSHDNYVAQWGDPKAESDNPKPLGKAAPTLEGEFFRSLKGVDLNVINSRDPYADQVGFSNGFTAGTDGERVWLTHCYGALGAGRGMASNSGNGAELYVVTGHAPRHLDRNVTLLGRAIAGIEHLSSLPRGSGPLGFYESPEEATPIISIRLGSDLPLHNRANSKSCAPTRKHSKTMCNRARCENIRGSSMKPARSASATSAFRCVRRTSSVLHLRQTPNSSIAALPRMACCSYACFTMVSSNCRNTGRSCSARWTSKRNSGASLM